jgi:hypothetical protein
LFETSKFTPAATRPLLSVRLRCLVHFGTGRPITSPGDLTDLSKNQSHEQSEYHF